MMFRVFIAVSHETELSLYAKLLPTTRDQLQIVTRAATNRPLIDQLRSAADGCIQSPEQFCAAGVRIRVVRWSV